MTRRMHFLGVTTTESSIMDLFPRWMEVLDLDAEIVGRDLPIGGEPGLYREAVEEIAHDERVAGALVTSHKVDVFRHAGELFQRLDRWAQLCKEVSCISKEDGVLMGWAKDPITSWLALDDAIGADYFERHPRAEVMCMGAGGSGTALTSRILSEPHPPSRLIVTNRSPEPLEQLEKVHEEVGLSTDVEYHSVAQEPSNDDLMCSLAPHSLVINATGLGKDTPGSPVSDEAIFPDRGVAWDFNYRGDLHFLEQARRQQDDRRLSIHDGWNYFLHGWSQHIAQVFGLTIDGHRFDQLAEVAETIRPSTSQ